MRIWTRILDLLYPPKCVFCTKLMRESETDICTKCRCSLPEVKGSMKRGECYQKCCSAYYYENAVAESVRRFKFAGQQQYAGAYGRILAMLILRENIEFDVLTWVPISDKRAKQRGYRQSKLLAQAIAKELGTQTVQTLKKKKDNPAQSSLKTYSDRKKNVHNVYEAYCSGAFFGKHILLVDDVITSGATLSECARTLKNAGAKSVVCVTLAAVRD